MDGPSISLAYFVDCICNERPFGPDPRNRPLRPYQFGDAEKLFAGIVDEFQQGRLRAFGNFAVTHIDFPDFCSDRWAEDFPVWARAVHKALREPKERTVSFGREQDDAWIPADAWWYEGAVWEKSLLWQMPSDALEGRATNLKAVPTTPFEPRYSTSLTQVYCYDDLQLHLLEVEDWHRRGGFDQPPLATTISDKPRNPKGAGVAPKADYDAVEKFVTDKIAGANGDVATLKWWKFDAVYQDIVVELWKGDAKVTQETVRQNLLKRPISSALRRVIPTLKS